MFVEGTGRMAHPRHAARHTGGTTMSLHTGRPQRSWRAVGATRSWGRNLVDLADVCDAPAAPSTSPASPTKGLKKPMLGLDGGADGDVADLDVVWLFDGEGNRAGDGLGRDREFVHAAAYLLSDGRVIDGIGQLGADIAR